NFFFKLVFRIYHVFFLQYRHFIMILALHRSISAVLSTEAIFLRHPPYCKAQTPFPQEIDPATQLRDQRKGKIKTHLYNKGKNHENRCSGLNIFESGNSRFLTASADYFCNFLL
ncbi:MAG: hypothetical protein NC389_13600, partial [Acetatifactor muris]|nr:hypothetical protein [Acetatifactor muris]